MLNRYCDMPVKIVQNVDLKHVLTEIMKDQNIHNLFQITTTL